MRKSKMDVRGNKLNEYQLGVTADSIRRDGRRDAKAIPRRRDNSRARAEALGEGEIKCTFLISNGGRRTQNCKFVICRLSDLPLSFSRVVRRPPMRQRDVNYQ